MGLTRVFQRSVRFTFRTKRRFLVFLVIFAIVSTLIALNLNGLDSLTTDELIDQKGVLVKKVEGVPIPYDKGSQLYNDVLQFAVDAPEIDIEASAMFGYADVDNLLRIHNIDIENPWISDFITPNFIQEGRFPNSPNEILVPTTAFQKRSINVGNQLIELQSDIAVGQKLDFQAGDQQLELEVVGKFEPLGYGITNVNDSLWLFMDDSMFDIALQHFGMTTDDVYLYMEAFVVEGLPLRQETYRHANTLKNQVETFIAENEDRYGNWQNVAEGSELPLQQTAENTETTLLTMGFVVGGGIILSTLFAYLISRFRRREIAILKAMGYSHGAVRTSLIAEILTTSFTGFLFGLGAAQGWLLYRSNFSLNTLIRLQALGGSFAIMVLVTLPGMLFASRRILGVSPAEAFRDN